MSFKQTGDRCLKRKEVSLDQTANDFEEQRVHFRYPKRSFADSGATTNEQKRRGRPKGILSLKSRSQKSSSESRSFSQSGSEKNIGNDVDAHRQSFTDERSSATGVDDTSSFTSGQNSPSKEEDLPDLGELEKSVCSNEEKLCPSCKRIVLVEEYSSHVSTCLQRFSYSKLENRECSRILPCPVCFKNFKSETEKHSHVKSCALHHGLSTEQLILATRLQEKQDEERLALGLPSPRLQGESGIRKKPASRTGGKKSTDQDLELAYALSRSLVEEQMKKREKEEDKLLSLGLHDVIQENRRKLVLPQPPPLPSTGKGSRLAKGKKKGVIRTTLMTRTKEERERIITEKVAAILTGEMDPVYPHPTSNKSHQTRILGPLTQFEDKESTLWNFARTGTDIPIESYFVMECEKFIKPQNIPVGELLRSYSQVPGRLNYTALVEDSDEERDDNDDKEKNDNEEGFETTIVDAYCTQLALAEMLCTQDLNDFTFSVEEENGREKETEREAEIGTISEKGIKENRDKMRSSVEDNKKYESKYSNEETQNSKEKNPPANGDNIENPSIQDDTGKHSGKESNKENEISGCKEILNSGWKSKSAERLEEAEKREENEILLIDLSSGDETASTCSFHSDARFENDDELTTNDKTLTLATLATHLSKTAPETASSVICSTESPTPSTSCITFSTGQLSFTSAPTSISCLKSSVTDSVFSAPCVTSPIPAAEPCLPCQTPSSTLPPFSNRSVTSSSKANSKFCQSVFHSKLVYDWSSLLASGDHSDVVILTSEEEILVHFLVLSVRCPKILKELVESENKKFIKWSDISYDCAYAFVAYLYSGMCSVTSKESVHWLGLFDLSIKYKCTELVEYLESVYKTSPKRKDLAPLVDQAVKCDQEHPTNTNNTPVCPINFNTPVCSVSLHGKISTINKKFHGSQMSESSYQSASPDIFAEWDAGEESRNVIDSPNVTPPGANIRSSLLKCLKSPVLNLDDTVPFLGEDDISFERRKHTWKGNRETNRMAEKGENECIVVDEELTRDTEIGSPCLEDHESNRHVVDIGLSISDEETNPFEIEGSDGSLIGSKKTDLLTLEDETNRSSLEMEKTNCPPVNGKEMKFVSLEAEELNFAHKEKDKTEESGTSQTNLAFRRNLSYEFKELCSSSKNEHREHNISIVKEHGSVDKLISPIDEQTSSLVNIRTDSLENQHDNHSLEDSPQKLQLSPLSDISYPSGNEVVDLTLNSDNSDLEDYSEISNAPARERDLAPHSSEPPSVVKGHIQNHDIRSFESNDNSCYKNPICSVLSLSALIDKPIQNRFDSISKSANSDDEINIPKLSPTEYSALLKDTTPASRKDIASALRKDTVLSTLPNVKEPNKFSHNLHKSFSDESLLNAVCSLEGSASDTSNSKTKANKLPKRLCSVEGSASDTSNSKTKANKLPKRLYKSKSCKETSSDKMFTPDKRSEETISVPRLNITPMPNYKSMLSPELKKELDKYGIRKLSRKKAVTLLLHIYDQMHPLVTDSEAETSFADTPLRKEASQFSKKPLRAASHASERGQERKRKEIEVDDQPLSPEADLNSSQTSNNTSIESEFDCLEETLYPDSLEDCDVITPTQQTSLENRIRTYIRSDSDLYSKILCYEPIWANELNKELKVNGIKCNLAKLIAFLDEQCITFRLPTRDRTRRRGQKRKNSSPEKIPIKSRKKLSPNKTQPKKK